MYKQTLCLRLKCLCQQGFKSQSQPTLKQNSIKFHILPNPKSLLPVLLAFTLPLVPLPQLPTLAQTLATTSTNQLQQGIQQYRHGQYPQALQTYQQILAIRRQQNDQPGIAQVLNNIGEVYIGLQDYDKALASLQQALAIRQQLKDVKGEGETLSNLGRVYYVKNDNNKALAALQQALTISREIRDKALEAKTLSRIGNVYTLSLKQYTKGLEFYQQALAIQQQIGDKFEAAYTLQRIAATYKQLDDYPHTLEYAKQALSFHQQIQNWAGEGLTLNIIASTYFLQNKYDLQLQTLQQALPLIRESGIRPDEYNTLKLIALAYVGKNQTEQTINAFQQALTFTRQNQLRPQELESLNLLLQYYGTLISGYEVKGLNSQAKTEASHLFEVGQQTLTLARVLKKPEIEASALTYLGMAYATLGDDNKAITTLQQAINIARSYQALQTETTALSKLNGIFLRQGNLVKVVENNLRQIEITRQQNNKFSEANDLIALGSNYNALGSNYNVLGEYQKAFDAFNQSLAITQKLDITKLSPQLQPLSLDNECNALSGLSIVEVNLGNYNKALSYQQQALQVAQTRHNPGLEADMLLNLAFLYQNTFKNYPQAIQLTQQALTIARQIKEPGLEAEALKELSQDYNQQGNHTQALESANQILVIAKQLDNLDLEQQGLDIIWQIYFSQGDYQKALQLAQQRFAILEKGNFSNYKFLALGNLTRTYIALGDTIKAEAAAKEALDLAKQSGSDGEQALPLLYLSQVYKSRGEYQQAIAAAQTALEISQKIKNFSEQVAATLEESQIYQALGAFQKVIALSQATITLAQKIGDRSGEAELLLNLGNAYIIVGNYPQAKQLIDQGWQIAQQLKNPRLESIALNNFGYYYLSLNDYQKALTSAQQSLKIAQSLKSPPLLISSLFNLGDIYNNLGQYNQSREYYQQALTTAQQLKNKYSEAVALFAEANTYFATGQPEKTIELSQQSLIIAQQIKQPILEAFATRMLSIGYGEMGEESKAMTAAQSFLTFAQETKNQGWEKLALSLIGSINQKFGHRQQAIAAYQQALAINASNQVPGANAGIYAGLARIYRDLNQPNVAINYYEQSVNQFESVRHGIQGLPPELQKSFLDSTIDFGIKTADIYRQLADLLFKQGRSSEGQQVEDLLKTQEIKDFNHAGVINQQPLPLNNTNIQIPASNPEIIALATKVNFCEQTNCQQKTQLNDQLTAAVDKFNQQLASIDNQIRTRLANDPHGTFLPDSPKAIDIVKAEPNTVMIYPLVLDDKLWLLLYSGEAKKVVEVPVKRQELAATVKQFRELMAQCQTRDCGDADIAKIKPVSQQLYNWLIKPIAGELQQNHVQNLVFALDRETRYIPMSALFDGQKYLIQQYNIYNVLSADLTNVSDRLPTQIQATPVLAMGVSDSVAGASPLVNVPQELNGIVKTNTSNQGVYPGEEFLNNSFDFRSLRDNLIGKAILHLATHGKFVSGTKDASFLLLGNGEKLTVSEIETLTQLHDIHMVVLSACQTALGGTAQDGVEINSLAYAFLSQGPKTVMASLWLVNDQSTTLLMQSFYKNLATNQNSITKSEALRLAQLSLIYGKQVTLADIKRDSISNASSKFAHPYYWAPFIIIGNGL